jgi:predicted nucleic acid-binding protein
VTVLIDSDILIEVSRAKDSAILGRWAELRESKHIVMCSPVSVAELWHGALPREHEATEKLFRALTCVPIDAGTGRQAGDFLRQYSKSHGVELGDALIASSAVLHGAALWTRNRKHYPMKGVSFY